jgi:2,3-dihydroxybenzoate-AMP ligase
VTHAPWPAALAERYRREGYWKPTTLGALMRDWARERPHRTALVDGHRRWTYAELDAWADRLARGLLRIGIGRGDRVVVQLPNVAEFVPLCFALFRIGALPVLALVPHRRSEVTHVCDLARAVAYVVPDVHQRFDHRELAQDVGAAVPSLRHVIVVGDAGPFISLDALADEGTEIADVPRPDCTALFLLSGGTTGLPKLVARTHEDYVCNLRATAAVAGLTERDVYLAALPVAHNFALGCPGIFGTFLTGGTVVLAPTPSADDAFPLIERERVTVSALVPPVAILWLEAAAAHEHDLCSLRLLQVGGAPFKAEHARRVRGALGCTLQQSFGMAEGMLIQTRPGDDEETIVTTQGRPVCAADELRIVDDRDRDVREGDPGHLLVRGPYTIRGYYRAGEHNRRAFTTDGFFRTGDIARMTAAGQVVVLGRSDDVINRGGEKVAAGEVEAHLLAHPLVLDAAVVAMPDEIMGSRTCAYVVLRGQLPAPELLAFLQARGLASYKVPDRIEYLSQLPRTSVGKTSKAVLRDSIATALRAGKGRRTGPAMASPP